MTLVKTNQTKRGDQFDGLLNRQTGEMKRINNFSSRKPSVNLYEEKERWMIEMAVPGWSKKDFRIEVNDDVLTVSANAGNQSEETHYLRREFVLRSFERAFTLSRTADSDHIRAHYENGILSIEIPKSKEALPRSIAVK